MDLLLCVVELLRGQNERGDGAPVAELRLLQGLLGQGELLVRVVEDGGHVLAGAESGRVVVAPEHVQEVAGQHNPHLIPGTVARVRVSAHL